MNENNDQALSTGEGETAVDELALLKERAKQMGIPFSNNISLETLRKRISDKMEGKDVPEVNPLTGDAEIAAITSAPAKLDAKQNALALRKMMQREQMKLVRVRITNMDPKKKDLPGEIWTVSNEYLGNVRKMIPYGEQTDEGFHIPYCLFRLLQSKRFLHIRTVKDRVTGVERQEKQWVKEFSLDVLPDLTKEELARLAAAQAAAGL
jgi:hypothetical protein